MMCKPGCVFLIDCFRTRGRVGRHTICGCGPFCHFPSVPTFLFPHRYKSNYLNNIHQNLDQISWLRAARTCCKGNLVIWGKQKVKSIRRHE